MCSKLSTFVEHCRTLIVDTTSQHYKQLPRHILVAIPATYITAEFWELDVQACFADVHLIALGTAIETVLLLAPVAEAVEMYPRLGTCARSAGRTDAPSPWVIYVHNVWICLVGDQGVLNCVFG